jgi:hypothetical protein
MLRMG